MRDVAAAAGVSVATVSHAVNGRAGLMTDATRDRVLAVAERLNYQPNLLMKAVRTRQSNVIGVMIPSFQSTFFPQIADSIERALRERGYHAVMCQTQNSNGVTAENLTMLGQRRVDGLIVTPKFDQASLYRPIFEAGMKTVFVDAYLQEMDIPSVQSDDTLGSYLAVQHLIENGHRRIATMHLPEASLCGGMRARFEGYCRALTEAGIAVDDKLIRIIEAGSAVDQGHKLGLDLLKNTDVTAVFLPSDFNALGVMRAAREVGQAIPDDLAVVGYNNQEAGQYTTPPLTTVDQKPQRIGQLAVERLMAMIHGTPDPRPLHKLIEPELLVRGSSIRRKPESVNDHAWDEAVSAALSV